MIYRIIFYRYIHEMGALRRLGTSPDKTCVDMHRQELKKTLESAENHCHLRGTRFTRKRKVVLSALLQSNNALTAYELIDICKTEFGGSLPPMSMYRILDFLESEGLIHRLKIANRYVACVHINCDHKHAPPQFLICGRCYRVEEKDVARTTLGSLTKNVESAGFSLISNQIELECLCDSCAHG